MSALTLKSSYVTKSFPVWHSLFQYFVSSLFTIARTNVITSRSYRKNLPSRITRKSTRDISSDTSLMKKKRLHQEHHRESIVLLRVRRSVSNIQLSSSCSSTSAKTFDTRTSNVTIWSYSSSYYVHLNLALHKDIQSKASPMKSVPYWQQQHQQS